MYTGEFWAELLSGVRIDTMDKAINKEMRVLIFITKVSFQMGTDC